MAWGQVPATRRHAHAPAGVAAAAVLAGCVNSISLPAEPPVAVRTIHVLDLGRHSRLAFELPRGGLVEYAYGEWRWYAGMEDSWWRLPAVLLWETRGTLGRRYWRGPGAKARLREAYGDPVVLDLPADRHKADALAARLDREFETRRQLVVRNRVYGLSFVPWNRDYWLFNNSNHAVGDWLRAAGFEVTGCGVFAAWKIERPASGTRGAFRLQRPWRSSILSAFSRARAGDGPVRPGD